MRPPANPYSDDDKQFIRDHWEKLSTRELAVELKRSYESVKLMAGKMGLFRKRPCTMVDLESDAAYMAKVREDLKPQIKPEYIDHYGIDSLPHLREASAAGCDVFVTTNESLLEDRKLLESEYQIKIRTPEEALDEAEQRE
jgi:hypothetical protein